MTELSCWLAEANDEAKSLEPHGGRFKHLPRFPSMYFTHLPIKFLTRLSLESFKNFAKILARFLQDSWQECLIIMQDPNKTLARFLQDLARII